jgi:hypothetical protein
MKKVIYLLLTVVLFVSCDNKADWNDIGKWEKGRFVVNEQISFENKEIVFAQNEAKDSTVAYIRYDLSVNDEIIYQNYFTYTTTKEDIVTEMQMAYEELLKHPEIRNEIIEQYPIEESPDYKSM